MRLQNIIEGMTAKQEDYSNIEQLNKNDPYWWTEFEDPEERDWKEAGCPKEWQEEDNK